MNQYDPLRTIERRTGGNLGLCAHPGCGQNRHGVSEYCWRCMTARRLYGHPKGRRIAAKEYATELREAQRYVARTDEAELRAVLEHTAAWLRDARLGRHVPAHSEMARLARHGVDPAALLAGWLALVVYSRRSPGALPDDARLTQAIAHRTLRLAPRNVIRTRRRSYSQNDPRRSLPRAVLHEYAEAPKAEREALGTHVRFFYAPFLFRAAAVLCDSLNQSTAFSGKQ